MPGQCEEHEGENVEVRRCIGHAALGIEAAPPALVPKVGFLKEVIAAIGKLGALRPAKQRGMRKDINLPADDEDTLAVCVRFARQSEVLDIAAMPAIDALRAPEGQRFLEHPMAQVGEDAMAHEWLRPTPSRWRSLILLAMRNGAGTVACSRCSRS